MRTHGGKSPNSDLKARLSLDGLNPAALPIHIAPIHPEGTIR